MDPAIGTRSAQVSPALLASFLAEPPGWTRLEPQSVSGDPTPGLEARLHDPLWMLARQWQLGEFTGEDVGSPVFVTVESSIAPIVAVQLGDPLADAPVQAWNDGDAIEPIIEREPPRSEGPMLRPRAEAGAQLVAELRDDGADDAAIAALIDACPLPASFAPPAGDPYDVVEPTLWNVLQGRVPDADAAAAQLEAGLAASPPTLPWLLPANTADAARSWLEWYRGSIEPLPTQAAGSWIDERLEYRFSVGIAGPDGQRLLRAPTFGGGRVDWYDFDHDVTSAPLQLPAGAPPGTIGIRKATKWATPLRFGGMPADRYWQFEDSQVNMGGLQVQPHDIARLALAEFAIIYGNDWIGVPIDVPYGSFVTVDAVSFTTTFGETIAVPEIDDSTRPAPFRLFEVGDVRADGTPTGATLRGLFVPPAAPTVFEGPFCEEVLFLRDEMANMAWAVERVVQGPSGDPRDRHDEPRPAPFAPSTDPGADMDYRLENEVPDWWIPLLPYSTRNAAIALRKGAMLKQGQAVQPRGVLLKPGVPLVVQDEEVPREGLRVRRVPALARRADGTYVRWVTRRVGVGRGEGASGLAFDSAVRRRPSPPE